MYWDSINSQNDDKTARYSILHYTNILHYHNKSELIAIILDKVSIMEPYSLSLFRLSRSHMGMFLHNWSLFRTSDCNLICSENTLYVSDMSQKASVSSCNTPKQHHLTILTWAWEVITDLPFFIRVSLWTRISTPNWFWIGTSSSPWCWSSTAGHRTCSPVSPCTPTTIYWKVDIKL